jgi:hypothetical protein
MAKIKTKSTKKKLHPGASDGLLPHLSSKKKKTGPQQRELLHRKRQREDSSRDKNNLCSTKSKTNVLGLQQLRTENKTALIIEILAKLQQHTI